MPSPKTPVPRQYVPDRAAWRAWLETHHETSQGLWLVYDRARGSKPQLSLDDILEEALCFGWSDTKSGIVDADQAKILMEPQASSVPWTELNKARVARMTAQGKMHASGLALVEAAEQSGAWDAASGVEIVTPPPDLEEALQADEEAYEHFLGMTNQEKKNLIRWVDSSRRPDVRQQRIKAAVKKTRAAE
jgi:uncharacterized protein YdeI (YjbR/CyaY-like superfamily)